MTENVLDKFLNQPAEWLKTEGPENDVVVSSRVRLARNVQGYSFISKLAPEDYKKLVDVVEKATLKSTKLKKAHFFRYSETNETDQTFLVERHLVSTEHVREKGERAVAISPREDVSLMILEEDHLRLQVFQSGFRLGEAWALASKLDDDLEKSLDYSFSPNFGYLTACPTNVGTGLRASCMLHLPSLVLTKQATKVLQALSKLNLAARGLYGEGSQATGNLFQISNQMTLGQPEEEIIHNLEAVIKQVIEHEKEARQFLKSKRKAKFEDQLWRALGTLKSARIISSAEAMQLLSLVQLGILMEMFDSGGLSRKDLNSLFLLIQPAHLQKVTGRNLSSTERDLRRAELIRKHIKKMPI